MMYLSRVKVEYVGGGPWDGKEEMIEWGAGEGCPTEIDTPEKGKYVRVPGFHPRFHQGGSQIRFTYMEP